MPAEVGWGPQDHPVVPKKPGFFMSTIGVKRNPTMLDAIFKEPEIPADLVKGIKNFNRLVTQA
eukprot:CAMPEP_0180497906 /NCGR_PEP_ID=MMETSP1036_2-20121128/43046_1 /TAXON_ID=632150 /ORGANISM="Azadinium spinosum, Strain 3D9" /LENGTH=62 /DNA_ID=CAMNT_0022506493 /DNA_START=57 /DNA_END=241 /DNA_ORIENTATION=-